MKEIQNQNLLNVIKDLSVDDKIFVSLDKKKVASLEYLSYKLHSCDLLFNSFLNNNSEISNQFNLTRFLDHYSELFMSREKLFQNIVNDALGFKVVDFLENSKSQLHYSVDYKLSNLIIRKKYRGNDY
ncbi:hypothetical protein [Dehalobacter sp. TBBPA1]|uniref:hypothetical protein n=1 Tax=Dehalobacter sp. TBBPA1 TaxID=3235037 RepID=UPI0034A2469B